MKLIQIKLVLLSLCLFVASSLFCQPNEKNTAQPTPNMTKSLSEITPEEFEMLAEEAKKLDEAIKALPEEERMKVEKQLEEFAVEVLENMPEEEQKQFFEFSAQLADRIEVEDEVETPVEKEEEITTEEITKPQPKIEITKNKAETQELLENIINKLDNIRLKASNDQGIIDKIATWEKTLGLGDKPLDDLRYYLEVIKQDKYIQYLLEKDFDYLFDNLKDLYLELYANESNFKVPEFGLEKLETKAKRTSQEALSGILSALSDALYGKNVIGDFEKLLKKHAPKELEIKKQIEEEEKKAKQASESALQKAKLKGAETSWKPGEPSYQDSRYYGPGSSDSYYPSYDYSPSSAQKTDGITSGRKKTETGGKAAQPTKSKKFYQPPKKDITEKTKEEEKKEKRAKKLEEDKTISPIIKQVSNNIYELEDFSDDNKLLKIDPDKKILNEQEFTIFLSQLDELTHKTNNIKKSIRRNKEDFSNLSAKDLDFLNNTLKDYTENYQDKLFNILEEYSAKLQPTAQQQPGMLRRVPKEKEQLENLNSSSEDMKAAFESLNDTIYSLGKEKKK